MGYYLLKLGVTTLLVVAVTEVSKRSTVAGGLLASLPLVSYLAILWIYAETKDTLRIENLSMNIFWLVLPSLAFFPLFAFLLRNRWSFSLSLAVSTGVMVGLYFLVMCLAKKAGFLL